MLFGKTRRSARQAYVRAIKGTVAAACDQRSGFLRSRRGAYRDRRLDGAHEHNFFWSRLEAGFNITCVPRWGEWGRVCGTILAQLLSTGPI